MQEQGLVDVVLPLEGLGQAPSAEGQDILLVGMIIRYGLSEVFDRVRNFDSEVQLLYYAVVVEDEVRKEGLIPAVIGVVATQPVTLSLRGHAILIVVHGDEAGFAEALDEQRPSYVVVVRLVGHSNAGSRKDLVQPHIIPKIVLNSPHFEHSEHDD